jgi:hypothetical protein
MAKKKPTPRRSMAMMEGDPGGRPGRSVPITATRDLGPATGNGNARPALSPGAADLALAQAQPPANKPLVTVTIAVVRGSLSQADAPVAIAPRYRGLPFAGASREFDYLLNSWLTRAIELGMIGSGLGELFRVPLERLHDAGKVKAEELLLVGMGEPGDFAADDLRYLMTNVTVAIKSMHRESASAPLIGYRRGEMSVELAARAFIEGVDEGYHHCRSMIENLGDDRARFLASFFGDLKIVLVEPDRDRAATILETFRQLSREKELVRFFQLCVTDLGEIPVLEMKDDESTDVPPEEVNHTLIRVTCSNPGVNAASMPASAAGAGPVEAVQPAVVFQYSALSQTATIPVRDLKSNSYFTRRLPERLKQAETRSEQEDFGELWANYLIPEEFLRMIEASGHLTLILDESTACFPWEMVAVRKYGRARFLGVDHQLARLFRTSLSTVRGMPPPINKHLRVLIIADPSPGDLELPNSRKEGVAVVRALQAAQRAWGDVYDIRATVRIGSSRNDPEVQRTLDEVSKATEVVHSEAKPCEPLELLSLIVNHPYDVVHYAGHGEFNPMTGRMGWVFDRDCVLSAEEIFRIRQVPRLVFANACFSAATTDYDRQRQPVGLAQAFFARGIQNYLGTGWAVQDDSALVFADRFYCQVLGISRQDDGVATYATAPPGTLGNALANARRAILGKGTTWGAYQLYGQANAKLLPFRNRPHDEAPPNDRPVLPPSPSQPLP